MLRRRKIRYYKGIFGDIINSIVSSSFGLGRHVDLFENNFAKYIGTKFAISACSGRVGLSLILDSLGLKEKSEIMLPAYTLKDLVYLIKDKGLAVKLIDVEEGSFNIDCNLIEREITDKTKVIIATHIFGLPCNMDKILSIGRKYNLKIIEDCAHAAGAKLNGKRVGSFGDAAFFSFESTKLLNTFGGGMITTNNANLAGAVRRGVEVSPVNCSKSIIKILMTLTEEFVINGPLYPLLISFFKFRWTTKLISRLYLFIHGRIRIEHGRLTNAQALIGLKQLSYLENGNNQRENIALQFDNRLQKLFTLQKNPLNVSRVYYFYVVNIRDTVNLENLRARLIDKGVDTGIKSEITDNCAMFDKKKNQCPVAARLYNSNLQIPIHDNLSRKDLNLIVKALREAA